MSFGMKIKAIAPWYGAKRNLAPMIVELLGNGVVPQQAEKAFRYLMGLFSKGC